MTPPIVELAFSLLVHGDGERYHLPAPALERLHAALVGSEALAAAAHALADLVHLLEARLGSPSAARQVEEVLVRALPRLRREAFAQGAARTAALAERGRRDLEAGGGSARAPREGSAAPRGTMPLRSFAAAARARA
jgi:hypothetical protein